MVTNQTIIARTIPSSLAQRLEILWKNYVGTSVSAVDLRNESNKQILGFMHYVKEETMLVQSVDYIFNAGWRILNQ